VFNSSSVQLRVGSLSFTMKTSSLISLIFYLSYLSDTSATPSHDQAARRLAVQRRASASANITTPTSTQTNHPTGSASSNGTTTDIVASSLSASVSTQPTVTTIVASSSSASVSTQPTATASPTDPSTAQDIETLHQRRLSNIVGALTNASFIPSWYGVRFLHRPMCQ
jgi:hypothetical protein